MALPKLFAKRFLGIDIGTSAIRIVELTRQGQKFELTNYGEVKTEIFQEEAFRVAKKGMVFFSAQSIGGIINAILEEAKIKTRQCAFSIPDFSTFFTNFKLPPMTKKELPQAVIFEARQHIPLPLESVTVDWNLVGGTFDTPSEMEVLLAAIPNEIVDQYREIARHSNLEVAALEAEVFGLLNSLIPPEEKGTICLVDIGTQSTTCSIIEKRILKTSHSFDIASNHLIDDVFKSLSLGAKLGQEIKSKYGLKFFSSIKPPLREKFNKPLYTSLDAIIREIKMSLQSFYDIRKKEIDKIIIAGGAALLPGIKEIFYNSFKKKVEIANPFQGLIYPPILEKELQKMAPVYPVAVGMAIKGIEIEK